MSPKWVIKDITREKIIMLKKENLFGRGKGNTIKLPNRFVSKRHFDIVITDEKPILINHSAFGTLLNKEKIMRAALLKENDELQAQTNTEKLKLMDLNNIKAEEEIVISDSEEEIDDVLNTIFTNEPWKTSKTNNKIKDNMSGIQKACETDEKSAATNKPTTDENKKIAFPSLEEKNEKYDNRTTPFHHYESPENSPYQLPTQYDISPTFSTPAETNTPFSSVSEQYSRQDQLTPTFSPQEVITPPWIQSLNFSCARSPWSKIFKNKSEDKEEPQQNINIQAEKPNVITLKLSDKIDFNNCQVQ